MKKASDIVLLFATFFVGLANIFYPRAITINVRELEDIPSSEGAKND